MTHEEFIARWKDSAGAELANSQSFLKELCSLLGVPQPDPTHADESLNTYVFEKAVNFNNGDGTMSPGRVDLYRNGCFVLESKQGSERKEAEQAEALATVTQQRRMRTGTAARGTPAWEQAMVKARQQARRYAEALPDWPPFLLIIDIGYCFDLYADFSGTGKHYVPFPDPRTFRTKLADLSKKEFCAVLQTIWLDPFSLDPSRRSAKATRELAGRLAELAKRLESRIGDAGGRSHSPHDVAQFLMRLLFTMFAEDVELLGERSDARENHPTEGKFTTLLKTLRAEPQNFVPMIENLWQTMNVGGFSPILRENVKQFNGGLFEDCAALPLNRDELELLIEAAEAQWCEVEPAIFGTLLERALDERERHKLGAHFTPRAYVERLVMPALIEPLREEWDDVYAASAQFHAAGETAEAVNVVRRFHERLCNIRVLDPACGSGNFLYVALELMKRLEGEVLNALREYDERQLVITGLSIDPHQFHGVEVNPRAAAIADLVLWIGYLQWHFRTRGKQAPAEPIIRKFRNIECRDAVLAWDSVERVFDDHGQPLTRWDGRTTKPHPVTGEEIPDESAQVQEVRYINPRRASWPEADFVVGNPPYLGARTNRLALGEGYLSALRTTYNEVPDNVDYVMYWWHRAAELVRARKIRRFGMITTKSISQSFAQVLVSQHFRDQPGLSIRFAIPNHPWVDSKNCAAVRVALTVCDASESPGELLTVVSEVAGSDGECVVKFDVQVGRIQPDLRVGADLQSTKALRANQGASCVGYQLTGQGFILSPEEMVTIHDNGNIDSQKIIRPLLTARDIAQRSRGNFAIDLFGHQIEQVRVTLPKIFQHVFDRVKPERDQNNRAGVRDRWWLYGECRSTFRPALCNISRMIVTPLTARFRYFIFVPATTICDSTTVMIALDSAEFLGILSSSIHITWAISAGGRMGVGNDPRYIKTRCFERFPFPNCSEKAKDRISMLAEQLDAHRKRQQALYPMLTMTGIYNVLAKIRTGAALSNQEQQTYEKGLVSVVREIHDDLDAAVFEAYGWPIGISSEEILVRLVSLNLQRAAEEEGGTIHWLRPELQNPIGSPQPAPTLEFSIDDSESAETAIATIRRAAWPRTLPERIRAVRDALAGIGRPATPENIASRFSRAPRAAVAELLDTLVAVGQARKTPDSRYAL